MPLKITVALHAAFLLAAASCVSGQDQPAANPQDAPSQAPCIQDWQGCLSAASALPQRAWVLGTVAPGALSGHLRSEAGGRRGRKAKSSRVTKALGKGADEKAIEAVQSWRFDPARKIASRSQSKIEVEVGFHLYGNNDRKIAELTRRAAAGDGQAELDLSALYFEGRDKGKEDNLGMMYLEKAARQGLPKARFLMGEHLAHGNSPDYPKAYLWYTLAHRSGYKHSDKKLRELSATMTAEQVHRGQALIDNWPNVSPK